MAGTIIALLADPLQGGFQGIERMEYMAYSDVINKSAQALLGVALALLGFREVGIAASVTTMAGVVLILNAVWLRSHLRIELRTNARALATMIRESVAYWAFGIFFVLYLWIDMTMLSLMTNETVVGWYAVPTRLFQTTMFFATVVATAWLPRLVRAFQESPARLRAEARGPLELVVLLGLPSAPRSPRAQTRLSTSSTDLISPGPFPFSLSSGSASRRCTSTSCSTRS